ncbi:MAG: DegV family protein [Lachnospiraceae bacterium]|nr:DegV family protein [Lachnospiraceae bacterium]
MYKILIDSCGELFDYMINNPHFASIPLTLQIDEENIRDDETFDQASFLKKVKESPVGPKSACPSPQDYMDEMEDADHIYIITLSSKLSGSYNSAVLAKDLFLEDNEDENPDLKIHVFDSKSASIGQTLIGHKIATFEEEGMAFEDIVNAVDSYIEEQHTFFVLETLETLRKAGRLGTMKAFIASALNIKPVMGSTPEGSIQQLGQGRGMAKTLDMMAKFAVEATKNCEEKTLAISHCNCPQTAEMLKEKLLKLASFKEIFVTDTRGVSSMYANDGGVILVV